MTADSEAPSLKSVILNHLANASLANRLVKGGMLLGGALVAGIAQFMDIEGSLKVHQGFGIIGTVSVFLAAWLVLTKEKDATEELRIAFDAKAEADERSEQIDQLLAVYGDLDRASQLIVAVGLLRGYIEHLCCNDAKQSEDVIVSVIFSMVSRQISLSMGLIGNDEWTICAYKAHPNPDGRDKLKLVADARAIPCERSAAREWEEGVGVAGICYSTEQEIVVPDFQSDGVGTLFNVGARQRDYDASRYQSIVAVPIQIDNHPRPWGVITATSDRRYHFRADAPGIQNTEGVRIMAGFIALALAITSDVAEPEQRA